MALVAFYVTFCIFVSFLVAFKLVLADTFLDRFAVRLAVPFNYAWEMWRVLFAEVALAETFWVTLPVPLEVELTDRLEVLFCPTSTVMFFRTVTFLSAVAFCYFWGSAVLEMLDDLFWDTAESFLVVIEMVAVKFPLLIMRVWFLMASSVTAFNLSDSSLYTNSLFCSHVFNLLAKLLGVLFSPENGCISLYSSGSMMLAS